MKKCGNCYYRKKLEKIGKNEYEYVCMGKTVCRSWKPRPKRG